MKALRRWALTAAAMMSLTAGCNAALAAANGEDQWKTHIVADKPGAVTLDPAKAYILLHSGTAVVATLMRMPDPDDAARHTARRAEALAKEHAKWVKKFASWQAEMKNLERMPATVRRPTRPVEPTEKNFVYPEYEQVHSMVLGPQNRFAKDDGSTYLQEVPPGEYLFYGVGGTCACLGTVSFAAAPGKVVAIDLELPFIKARQELPKEQWPATPFDLPPGTTTMQLGAAHVTDSRLPQASIVAPAFKSAGHWPNWAGTEVDRVMPIEGVFRYDGDKQIDLRPSAASSLPATTAATALPTAPDLMTAQ